MHRASWSTQKGFDSAMRFRRCRTRAVVFGVLAALAQTVSMIGAHASSTSSEAMSVTADPPTGLLDGQYVHVTWAGYPAAKGVTLAQCTQTPLSLADCSAPSRISRTKGDGTGEKFFPVTTGDFSQGFSCGSDKPCSIGVFWGNFGEELRFSQGSFAKIEFAPSLASCPPATGEQIVGVGSSAAYQAILRWEGAVCRAPYSLNVQYTVKNSVDGLQDFAAGDSDFAGSALPLTADHVEIPANPRQFVSIAAALSGVSFGFTIFDQKTGAQVTDLKLTPRLVAEIFTGALLNPNTDDREDGIRKLNPGVSFPSRLRAVGRADKAASTYYMTSWFQAVAKDTYEAGGPAYKGGSTSIYPSTGAINLVTGGEAVAKATGPQADNDQATFGWMDSSWAAFYGIPTAAVLNPAGDFVSVTDSGALAAGANAAMAKAPSSAKRRRNQAEPPPASFFPLPDFATMDPKAYPLPMINHFFAPTALENGKAATMKSFFDYALGDGQKALPPGYVPLPEAMLVSSRKSAATIGTPAVPQENAGGGGAEGEETEDPATLGSSEETALGSSEETDGPVLEASSGPSQNSAALPPFGSGLVAPLQTGFASPPLATPPSARSSPPPLLRGIAEAIGKANPLSGSSAWMILPGLAIAAIVALALGPAIGLPAWVGMFPRERLKSRLRMLGRR